MKYYIIAGEASGDLHGSNLMKALLKQDLNAEFRFWGGDLMQNVSNTLVKHYKDLAFMGFLEVVMNLRTITKNLRFCKQDVETYNPDVLIFIDYPGFNLRIAKWVVAAVVQLDPDRARVDILLTCPFTSPGVPGAPVFGHHLPGRAIAPDQIMGGYFCLWVTQPMQSGFSTGHGRIVQYNQRWFKPVTTWPAIGRAVPDGRHHPSFRQPYGMGQGPRYRHSHRRPGPALCGPFAARLGTGTRFVPDRVMQTARSCGRIWRHR